MVDDTRDKAIRLFQYLKEVAALQTTPILHFRQYETCIWLSEFIADSESLLSDESQGWFSVPRVQLPERPESPLILNGWIDDHQLDNWRATPVLRQSIAVEKEIDDTTGGRYLTTVDQPLSESPDVNEAWISYSASWYRWQAECERLGPAYTAYQRLFAAHLSAEQLGEQYELVLGIGLLAWATSSGQIHRHLVTAPAEIELDTVTGDLLVAPAQDGGIRFEQEMVPANMRPQTSDVGVLQTQVEEIGDVLAHDAISDLLRSWVVTADADGEFEPTWDRPSPRSHPVVSLAPALCLRRRSFRSLTATYESILEQLADTSTAMPDTIRDLVSFTGARLEGDETAESNGWAATDGNVYFPLASNDQQRKIIHTLGDRRGLVVQGPPGTGKSQTIANLICHCLATGRRVLVTSHTERALRVLQEKLPLGFEQLTVNVTGSGRSASKDVERSANALLGRMSDPEWDLATIDSRITSIRQQLAQVRDESSEIRLTLAEIQESRSDEVTIAPGYTGVVTELVERLANEVETLGWIEDDIEGEPPLTGDEVAWLAEWQSWSRSQATPVAHWFVPDVDAIPDAGEFAEVVASLSSHDQRASKPQLVALPLDRFSEEERQELSALVAAVQAQEEAIERRRTDWMVDARVDIEAGRDEKWRALAEQTAEVLESCRDVGPFSNSRPFELQLEELERRSHLADALRSHLANGGSLRRIGRAKVVREAASILAMDVDGVPVDSLDSVEEISRRLSLAVQIGRCARLWDGVVELAGPTVGREIADLADALESLEFVLTLHDRRVALGEALDLVDPEVLPATSVEIAAELDRCAALDAVMKTSNALDNLADLVNSVPEELDPHPAAGLLASAISERSNEQYSEALFQLQDAAPLAKEAATARTHVGRLDAACPQLAASLETVAENSDVRRFEEAWYWRQARSRIAEVTNVGIASHYDRLSALSASTSDLVAALGELEAWRFAIVSLTDEQASHLKAYQGALRRLGKGTGKRAATHRAEARRHLAACQQAIPAWIMPTYRVAETIAANPHAFDVIIVDEASQSGVDALFLFWLGKQMIIVGDDNQISPSNVGAKDAEVAALIHEYVSDFELRDVLDIKHSLFDQAKTRYSGEVWLTEHFRCMPEIIEFSNRAVYAPQHRRLDALRQFGSDRLAPLRRIYVPKADEEAKVNRAEVDALIRQVVECHGDPAYEGKTFGVISLLGDSQARVIEQQLFERLGQQAWAERELRCGSAYDFQGDERDVIFLSMVKAGGEGLPTIRKLGLAADTARFNVAASRAKDQMWLFHSMTIDELNPECIRAQLLRHFMEPPVLDVVGFEEKVSRDVRHSQFDSLFEQRVFLDLRERGYVVEPQVAVYGKRIDLVVAGAGGKLAVECDGSAFHGPDEFAADVARQQELERIGWVFHRVSDIDYYTQHEATMDALEATLSSLGIYPSGMLDAEIADFLDESKTVPGEVAPQPLEAPDEVQLEAELVDVTPLHSTAVVEPIVSDLAAPLEVVSEPASVEEQRDVAGLPVVQQPATDHEPLDSAMGPVPYQAWQARALADPTELSVEDLVEILVEIVSIEGPIVMDLLFRTVNDAAGNKRLGGQIRKALERALGEAVGQGRLLVDREADSEDPQESVRTPSQPKTKLREAGRRSIHEVPRSELSALMRHLAKDKAMEQEALFRSVLSRFGTKKLTTKTSTLLQECLGVQAADAHSAQQVVDARKP